MKIFDSLNVSVDQYFGTGEIIFWTLPDKKDDHYAEELDKIVAQLKLAHLFIVLGNEYLWYSRLEAYGESNTTG